MLSDEVLTFFAGKGLSCARLFETFVHGASGGWQITLFDKIKGSHLHEQGPTPVEAVAAMVARLNGRVDLVPSRSTGKLEANIAARLADNWAWVRAMPR